jgi:hypothetical protein
VTEEQQRERIYAKIASVFGPNSRSYIGENNRVIVEWGRYTIRCDARDPVIHLRQLLTAIGRAEARIAESVAIVPEKLAIEICRREEDLPGDSTAHSRLPGWLGGTYDGEIRVLSDPLREGTPHSLYVFLTHEMVHAVLAAIPGRRIPGWFEEGLAVFMSQNLPEDYREALAEALRERRVFRLDALDGPFTQLAGAKVALAYAQATSVVEYLLSRWGEGQLKDRILRARRRGFDAMLRSEALSPFLIEQGWKRWVVRRLKS